MNEERNYEIIEGNYPEDLTGKDVTACFVKDQKTKKKCIKEFRQELKVRKDTAEEILKEIKLSLVKAEQVLNAYALTKKEAEEQINSIYREALNKDLDLLDEASVPTVSDKISAFEAVFTAASQNCQSTQAAVEEYKNYWVGKASVGSDWNTLDPQRSHCSGCHGNLRTERRKLIWDAINRKGDFPSDLSDSGGEIYNACQVSPGTNNICADSIRNEIRSRREKDQKAKEAKEKLEAMKDMHEAIQSWGNKFETTNDEYIKAQGQVNKLTEEQNNYENQVNDMGQHIEDVIEIIAVDGPKETTVLGESEHFKEL